MTLIETILVVVLVMITAIASASLTAMKVSGPLPRHLFRVPVVKKTHRTSAGNPLNLRTYAPRRNEKHVFQLTL